MKSYKVLIQEVQGYYTEVNAKNEREAQEIVRRGLDCGKIVPIEDNSWYEGYEVVDAIEVKHLNSENNTLIFCKRCERSVSEIDGIDGYCKECADGLPIHTSQEE